MCAASGYGVALLALLAAGVVTAAPTETPTEEDCDRLVKLLPADKLSTVFGEWFLIEGYSDDKGFAEKLRMGNSSKLELQATSSDKNVIYKEGNMIDDTCVYFSIHNMTVIENTIQITRDDGISRGHFLHACPDCLVMHLSNIINMAGVPIRMVRSFYIFGKTDKLQESELEPIRKQAKCLKFPQPAPFIYDGATGEGEPPHHPEIVHLYERLLAVETRGELVSRELTSVLVNLRNLTRLRINNTSSNIPGLLKRNLSLFSSRLPNTYLYLPHLRDNPDGLIPHVVVGQGRTGVSLVLGIPTVKRQKQSYLVSTLNSLLFDLSPSERNDTVIIVFVAETDIEQVNSVGALIKKNFPKDVHSGLLEVVSPSHDFYPNFSRLRETFGDSKERVRWRTKQNLDYSFLMLYAQAKGTYYVQLEDDIVAKPGYSQAMKTYVRSLASDDWMFLEFSQLGFIGKMFRTRDLPMIAEFFLMFHRDKPIDWLLDHILWVKACNPEKDVNDCNKQKGLLKLRYKPSLFQHVGLHSSLPGKLQKLKDKDFGKAPLFTAHSNPPAELSSSLEHYQQHTLERAYRGEDFFWGLAPVAGDFIRFNFPEPCKATGSVDKNHTFKWKPPLTKQCPAQTRHIDRRV